MNRLRVHRAMKDITQFRLSISTGINPSRLSLIENELIQPRGDEIEKLSKALGVKSEELFDNIETNAGSKS